MIAPLSRKLATRVESSGGASMANATSLPPAECMSFASYQFLTEKVTQYMGSSRGRDCCRTRRRAPRRARERPASVGRLRIPAGAPAGSGPAAGALSYSPRQPDRTLAADVQGFERVDLPRVRNACDDAHLLHGAGVRDGRLHPADIDRRSYVLVEVREHLGHRDRSRRKGDGGPGTNVTLRRRNGCAVCGDESGARPVVSAARARYAFTNP